MAMQQSPLQPFNPFEIWSSAMSAAIEATRAAAAPWLPPVDDAPPSGAAAGIGKAESHLDARADTQPLPSIFSFFAPSPEPAPVSPARPRATPSWSTPSRPTPAAQPPVPQLKSWYRAPYISPFDPTFWLSPGHPADHLPQWMAMTGMAAMIPGTAMAPTGWPTLPMPWAPAMPALNPWARNPWVSSSLASNPWSSSPSTDSLGSKNPWVAWLEASSAGWSAFTTPPVKTDNVVDFSAAYSAYRTAGGHASAQITRDSDSANAPRQAPTQPSQQSSAFPLLNPFWPWLNSH